MIVKVVTGRSVHFYSDIRRVDSEGIYLATNEGQSGEMVKLDNANVFAIPSEHHTGINNPVATQSAQIHTLLEHSGKRTIVAVNCSSPGGVWLMTDDGENIDKLPSFAHSPSPEAVAKARLQFKANRDSVSIETDL